MRVVTIGGGTGQFAILRALIRIQDAVRANGHKPSFSITAIPSTMDSGGASGNLRVDHHIIAVGDIGQCILALCEDPERDAWLFDHRRFFKAGDKYSTFRNYVVSQALLYYGGDGALAMEAIVSTFRLRGAIAPVTLSRDTQVKAVLKNGTWLESEDELYRADLIGGGGIEMLWLEPEPEPNPCALAAIAGADAVIVCPGTLACSIVPNLRVPGIAEALRKSRARTRIYAANLMNERRRVPAHWTVQDYLCHLEADLGEGFFNVVICNTAPVSGGQACAYKEESSVLLPTTDLCGKHRTLIALPLMSAAVIPQADGDALADFRSTVRHDPALTARALARALEIEGAA